MEYLPKIRCMGISHSWSPLFADDGAWLIDTSGLNNIDWSATDSPTQVIHSPPSMILRDDWSRRAAYAAASKKHIHVT